MHHSTHTESAQHHRANTRVAQAHDTHVHVASLALNPRRYVVSAVRDAKHSNAERRTARARDTCTTHTHNAAVHNTTGHIQHCMSTVSTATRCVHSRALLSRLHLPPTTYPSPGVCAQSPSCTANVQSSGGAAFCWPLPRDSDAPLPHARKRTMCTTVHTLRARSTTVQPRASHGHVAHART